jgi:hypothetical protein
MKAVIGELLCSYVATSIFISLVAGNNLTFFKHVFLLILSVSLVSVLMYHMIILMWQVLYVYKLE